MKTLAELKQLYMKELAPVLTPLEARRKSLASTLMIIGAVVVVIALVMFAVSGGNPVLIIAPLIIGVVILAIVFKFIGKSYVSDFKTSVIGQHLPLLHGIKIQVGSRRSDPAGWSAYRWLALDRPDQIHSFLDLCCIAL